MVILIYLLIVTLSVFQSAATKAFGRQSKNSFVFNAIKASSALVLFGLMAAVNFTFHLPTALLGMLYGTLLALSMYAGYKALCLGPMAITSMLASFSVVIPLCWGITVGNETLKPLQTVALVLLFLTVVIINADKFKRSEKETSYGLWFLFIFITFAVNGINSILQKQHQTLYPSQYSREFMFFAMLVCTVVFVGIMLIKMPVAEIKATPGKHYGLISGVGNGLANFFTLILAGMENASVLFPIISAGTILGVLLFGRLVFKEKLKTNHYIALVLGIIAVILLKL